MTETRYAPDLARDLGYPDATPAFWAWCDRVGLRPLFDKPMAFDAEDVRKVLALS